MANETRHAELPWVSISARDHQPRRLAVLNRPRGIRHVGVLFNCCADCGGLFVQQRERVAALPHSILQDASVLPYGLPRIVPRRDRSYDGSADTRRQDVVDVPDAEREAYIDVEASQGAPAPPDRCRGARVPVLAPRLGGRSRSCMTHGDAVTARAWCSAVPAGSRSPI